MGEGPTPGLLEAEFSAKGTDGEDHSVREEFIENEEINPGIPLALLEESRRTRVCSEALNLIRLIWECFGRIVEKIDEDQLDNHVETVPSPQGGLEVLLSEASDVHKLGLEVESRSMRYGETKTKEKDLENTILRLSEENSDISDLLRMALVEKEAAEKTLSKLKGGGEQKRMAILQVTEWGLQKAGFSFVMGGSTGETSNDDPSNCNASTTSHGSESEEDGVSLVRE